MRLSVNWLVRNIALVFIEFVRNTPQLVQIIFWYFAVLQALPPPRQSIALPAGSCSTSAASICQASRQVRGADVLWPLALAVLLATPFVWRLRWRGLALGSRSLLVSAASACCSLADRAHRIPDVARLQHRRRHPGGRPNWWPSGPGSRSTPPPSSPRSCASSILAVPKGQHEAARSPRAAAAAGAVA